MPHVYITNKSGHDFSPAQKFGDLIYLSEGKINPFSVAKIYRQFADKLKKSAPDDYIMVTGLSLMNGIAFSIMGRKHGRLNILQFHSQTKTYKSRTIIVDELIGEISAGKTSEAIEEDSPQ